MSLRPSLDPNFDSNLDQNLNPNLDPNLDPNLNPGLDPSLNPSLDPSLPTNSASGHQDAGATVPNFISQSRSRKLPGLRLFTRPVNVKSTATSRTFVNLKDGGVDAETSIQDGGRTGGEKQDGCRSGGEKQDGGDREKRYGDVGSCSKQDGCGSPIKDSGYSQKQDGGEKSDKQHGNAQKQDGGEKSDKQHGNAQKQDGGDCPKLDGDREGDRTDDGATWRQRWNPFCSNLPYHTLTSHPLLWYTSGEDAATYDVLDLAHHLSLALGDLATQPDTATVCALKIAPMFRHSYKQPTNKQPTNQLLTHKQPTSNQFTHKQPTGNQFTHKQPTDKQPTDKQPTDKQPTGNQFTHKQPTDKQPTDKQPTHKQPTDKQPTVVDTFNDGERAHFSIGPLSSVHEKNDDVSTVNNCVQKLLPSADDNTTLGNSNRSPKSRKTPAKHIRIDDNFAGKLSSTQESPKIYSVRIDDGDDDDDNGDENFDDEDQGDDDVDEDYKLVVENYVGLVSLLHNATHLGYFKMRGKISF
ncbi:hypothetical protein FHG87_023236 [Trinorchestia longiramus]|nr:hypothetical protein FHG87_023236 [Trinorchestia longiramus]